MLDPSMFVLITVMDNLNVFLYLSQLPKSVNRNLKFKFKVTIKQNFIVTKR